MALDCERMGHPEVENQTPFAFEPVFVADEDGRPLLVPVVKGTWALRPSGPALAEEQVPVLLEGESYGDPAESSWRYEPEGTLPRPATDVVLVGSAVAPKPGTIEMLVAFQVGAVKKGVKVVGDRAFYKATGSIGMTKPVPFERIPLQWERAFGGWDRSHPDEKKHDYERRNPLGCGFRASGGSFEPGLRPPNLEDPARPFKGYGDRPPPAGFGFTSASWEPRIQWAGTYGPKWEAERAPLLPTDFDRRFLNAAPPGQICAGFLRGDEQVAATGVTPGTGLAFRLPGVAPPTVEVEQAGLADASVATRLETVVVDTDREVLLLLWRGETTVREPTSVRSIRVVGGAGTPPRPEKPV